MNEAENYDVSVKHRRFRPAHLIAAALAGFMLAALLGVGAFFLILKPENEAPEPPTYSGEPSFEALETDSHSDSDETLPTAASPHNEVRGAFIATVVNINYPSKPGLSPDEQRAELDEIIAGALEANLNALYFQVRPASDALYVSDIFPTSAYLTGEQGRELEFDPLAYLVERAHENGIKLHAWVNPLRITTGSATSPQTDVTKLAATNPARLHPEWAVAYADGRLYYDAGIPEVRELVAEGVRELCENYAIDGVIFDDYFYPYPVTQNGKTIDFDDAATFKAYGSGKKLADWRRENINEMVKLCYEAVKSVREECEFGIAPFGIWQNDDGSNGGSETSGFESYESIYCDPTAWVEGGYVDYLAPQLYWRFTTSAARYDTLVRWWNTLLDGTGVDLLISHGVYNYADGWENPENELRNQIGFARSELTYRGSILYGWAAMMDNSHGLLDEIKDVFSRSVQHYDPTSNGRELTISIPYEGEWIDGDGTFLLGTSDPAEPLYLDGEKLGRTKSGYFSVYLPLKNGENTFTFEHKGETLEYKLNGGTQPVKYPSTVVHAKLDGYTATCYPTEPVFTTATSLKVTLTAPSGSYVTAEFNGKTYTMSPTLYPPNQAEYMKEIYTATLTLPTQWSTDVKSLGTVKFTATRMSETATAESAEIRVGGSGATIPVEITANNVEMKVQPDSWYYDDYSVQSAGMRDNAVSLSDGFYKLRCGGYVSSEYVRELEADPLGIAEIKSAKITRGGGLTKIAFEVTENVPLNCYVENGEFVVTLYNVSTQAPAVPDYAANPMFSSLRSEKSAKAYAYKYFFKLYNIENFYGFDYSYSDGILTVELTEPTLLPDSETPLVGKTIILDAGHGGKNPGALGPLGSEEGALNESDFNLEIVMATLPKLEALGAKVVLIRDRECEIDVPIADRLATLIDVSPDLCVSVHQNSMPYTTDVTKIRGVVGLYWADSGYLLTDKVGETMSKALDRLDRSPTKQRLAMVRNPKFPATLVETCFITNVEEYERMMEPDALEVLATSLTDGILAFYEAQEKYVME